jgi:pyridoxal phosphate enzyme (YggS family)
MSHITENLQAVHAAIVAAARNVSRNPSDIALLAVSKTFGPDAVLEAFNAGQRAFGENYLQEALDKMAALQGKTPDLEWHFIGPVQSNKTRPIAEHFDWVHSVDRLKIAQRLSEQRPAHLPSLNICLQVNISGEASKSGVTPAELPVLAHAVAALPRLTLRGLMAIPEPASDEAAQRQPLRALRVLVEQLRSGGLALDTLSMGMSGDLAAAIAEGSTMVRIGTAIFGKRDYAK